MEVVYCSSLNDFSPLKYVREVKIKHCVGFQNSEEVAYVSIIRCNELTDLSKLMKVRELYLDHCDKVVYCALLDKIPNISIKHCKKLKQYHVTPINDFGVRDLGVHDALSSLPDSLHLEILKYLQVNQIRSMISCNTHFYQRHRKTSFETDDPPFKIEDEMIASETLQIPLTTKAIRFDSCSFSSCPRFPRGLKQLEFENCDGMKNITDFCEAEEVRIGRGSSVDQYDDEDDEDSGDDGALNLVSLNRIRRLILDAREEIKDYSPLQDNEEIIIFRYLNSNDDVCFKASKAFSNTKKIKLFFKFPIDIEIDLAFYQKLEVFDLSGGNFQYNGLCPPTLRKLYFSRLRKLTLPPSLDHLHLVHITACRNITSFITSLHGLGSIPNIKLSTLPGLKSLEGLGPANQFVQLLYLNELEDFSAVSGCRKVVLWFCSKLKDVSVFAESNYLVIGECDNLADVSMLGKVKHLELIRCNKIMSLAGLEGVKELIVSDCRLLANQNNTSYQAWSVSPVSADVLI